MSTGTRGLCYRLLLGAVVVSLGCGADNTSSNSQDGPVDIAGIGPGRVGSIHIGASIDSVVGRADPIGGELRTSVGGGDLDRYLRVAIEDDTLEIVPSDGRVREVIVRSARWRTPEGLGVGTSALDLSRHALLAIGFSADGLVVNVRANCGVDFVLGEARVEAAEVEDEMTTARLAQLGDSVRVTMVVVSRACEESS